MSDRLLVFGGTGMIGHRLVLEAMPTVDTWWTARDSGVHASRLLPMDRRIAGIDITDSVAVTRVIGDVAPTVVINCAGTVKQRTTVTAAEVTRTNSLFPLELAKACDQIGARLVHISTDHVYAGVPGDRPFGYSTTDAPDAVDVYGRSKLMGEINRAPHLTVRTGMIGPELSQHLGLFDWFRSAEEPILGYRRALFTGFTTPALARVLLQLGFERSDVCGIHHLAGPAIDKCSLLLLLRDHFRRGLTIIPDDEVCVDRRLDGRGLADLIGLVAPSWDAMLDELEMHIDHYSRKP